MLTLSVLALIAGPLLFRLFESRQHFYRLMDGFIVVVITGIVMIEVMPEIIAHIPILGLSLLFLGFLGPTILEQLFHKAATQVHRTALLIGVAGIVFHTLIDGIALYEVHDAGTSMLGWGIILHRLPVGITIWWLIQPRYGRFMALAVIALMVIGTFAGYWAELAMGLAQTAETALWLQALVAGAILHVVIHRPHFTESHAHDENTSVFLRWSEGIGNIAGLGVLMLILFFHMGSTHGHSHAHGFNANTADIFLGMALESAPALLLAYLAGGLMSAFLPTTSIRWMKKGPALGRSVKGMMVGLPLPICTCGVLPLYQTLIKRGAPPTAAMAFLIATPELGLDALLISVPLLGGDMTIVRLVAAASIALIIGWSVGKMAERMVNTETPVTPEEPQTEKLPTSQRVKKGLREGFGGLVDDTAPWILVGLLVAALAQPLLSQGWIQSLPSFVEVLFFALLGLPVYVCASGATPIVAVLLISGISPGAALAFLLTGPATNVSTFGILSKLHGKSIALIFGLATMTIAVSMGFAVNTLLPTINLLTAADLDIEHTSLLQQISLFLLLAIFLASLLRRGARAFVGEVTANFRLAPAHVHSDEHSHETNHSCGDHCERC